MGVKTKTDSAGPAAVNHDDYKVDSHASLACADCHAPGVASDAICVTCHPFSKYQGLGMLTNVNHTTNGAGTHCNKCHYSNKGATANKGWRWPDGPISKTRIPHSQWHDIVKGTCLDCHTAANEPRYPVNHSTTGCERCHNYNSGSWKGAAGHSSVTSGCSSCHPARSHTIAGSSVTAGTTFSGVGCETCHQVSITGGYKNWLGAVGSSFHAGITDACLNCHTASSIPTYPAGHYSSGCERCHKYNNGTWKGATGHPAATSGCSNCHTKHYPGYTCEWCHTATAAGGYVSWALVFDKHSHRTQWDSRACSACHGAGGFGD